MGFRFNRRIKILPGIRLNLSRSGVSTSICGRGAWLTFRPGHKARATVGLPGTGISYTTGGESVRPDPVVPDARAGRRWSALWIGLLIVGTVVAVVLLQS